MHRSASVLVYLACVGQVAQGSQFHSQDVDNAEKPASDTAKALATLLLACESAVAFNPSNAVLRTPTANSGFAYGQDDRVITMSAPKRGEPGYTRAKFKKFFSNTELTKSIEKRFLTPEEMAERKAREKSDDKAKEKSDDKAKDTSDDKEKAKKSDKAEDKSDDKAKEKSDDKTMEKSDDKEKAQKSDKAEEKSDDKAGDKDTASAEAKEKAALEIKAKEAAKDKATEENEASEKESKEA